MQETDNLGDAASTAQRAEAFRRVAEGSLHDAYRLAGAILGSSTDARDAVHDAFILGWRRYPSLRDPSKFDSWFKRIIVNTCRERLRHGARRKSSDIESHANLPALDPSQGVHDRVLVQDALLQLKPEDRIVLALRYYRDLKVDDIAAILDVPPGTVKSRLNHAHSRLRAAVERSQSGGGS